MKNSKQAKQKPAPAVSVSVEAPETLSVEAKRWWQVILEDFEVDDRAGLLLLTVALKAFDEGGVAEAILKTDGPVITDRWGQKKQHPATLVLRDSRNTMLRALKALNLDVVPNLPLGSRNNR